MEIGDWNIQGTLNYIHFIYMVVLMTFDTFAIVWFTIIIFRELKGPVIDLFKIIQPWLGIIVFLNYNFGYIRYIWYLTLNDAACNLIFVILLSSIWLYYAANLLTSYLLIFHIRVLHQIRSGTEYSELRKLIRRAETKALIILAILEIAYIVIGTICVVLYSNGSISLEYYEQILYFQLAFI